MEAGGDKEHGEGIRERLGQGGRRGGEVDNEVRRESRGADHRAGFFECLQAVRLDMKKMNAPVLKGRKSLNIRKQCKLLGIIGNAIYYKPTDASESVEVLQQAIARFGTPKIINSDWGASTRAGFGPKPAGIR